MNCPRCNNPLAITGCPHDWMEPIQAYCRDCYDGAEDSSAAGCPHDWMEPIQAYCRDCYDGAEDSSAVARIIGRGTTVHEALADWRNQYEEATGEVECVALSLDHAPTHIGLCDDFWCSRRGPMKPLYYAGHVGAHVCALGCQPWEDS